LDLTHAEQAPHAASAATTAAAASSTTSPAVPLSSSTSAGVVAPIAVFQPQPNLSPALLSLVRQLRRAGKIDVVINEQGTVDEVTVTQPVTPVYDKLILAAAKTWRYKPALKDGVPIKYVSTVVINVSS